MIFSDCIPGEQEVIGPLKRIKIFLSGKPSEEGNRFRDIVKNNLEAIKKMEPLTISDDEDDWGRLTPKEKPECRIDKDE